nr:polyphenol oxidase I, chloroplastic-like [Ipomoea batatas]
MVIPSVFTTNHNSSLYNENRNQSHLPPTVVDLGYDSTDTPATDQDRISNNLFLIYKSMVSNAGTAEMFLGKPYRAGYIVFKEEVASDDCLAQGNLICSRPLTSSMLAQLKGICLGDLSLSFTHKQMNYLVCICGCGLTDEEVVRPKEEEGDGELASAYFRLRAGSLYFRNSNYGLYSGQLNEALWPAACLVCKFATASSFACTKTNKNFIFTKGDMEMATQHCPVDTIQQWVCSKETPRFKGLEETTYDDMSPAI